MSVLDSYGAGFISIPPPEPSRGHRRSRTTIELPALFSRTPSTSPTRSTAFMPFGGKPRDSSPNPWSSADSTNSDRPSTGPHKRPVPGTASKIASWFEGSSEPVNITLIPSPRKEESNPFYQLDQTHELAHDSTSNMDNLTKRPQSKYSHQTGSANNSMFNFFKKTATPPVRNDPDELVRLQIREALFPDGHVEEITPAAFRTLQLSAESLLRRFQTAYTENIDALRKIRSEKSIQADELEAERMKNEHLKLQLLEMADKAAEQEKVIVSLKSQLANQSSIRMVDNMEQYIPAGHGRRTRISDVSASDASFVDSEASSAVSIFSDVESIRTPSTSTAASPHMRHASICSPRLVQGSAVQPQITPVLVSHCQNCHNVPASEAWDLVEMMKMEGVALKERIADLESAQDSALDFLTNLKL